jgi:hypothetical protein
LTPYFFKFGNDQTLRGNKSLDDLDDLDLDVLNKEVIVYSGSAHSVPSRFHRWQSPKEFLGVPICGVSWGRSHKTIF